MTAPMAHFSEHGLVDLILEDQARRAARITAVGKRHILLTLFAGDGAVPIGPDFTAAALEAVGSRGVTRVEGAVASVASVADRQALTFKPRDPAALRERRATPRVALDRGILLTRREGSEDSAAGRVLDLSSAGMRFRSAASFVLGERVHVTLNPRSVSPQVGAAGRIVRVDTDEACGLVFEDGPEAHRTWVNRLISSPPFGS